MLPATSETFGSMRDESFLAIVVAFPDVAGGDPCEVLLWVADQLCAELEHPEGAAERPSILSQLGTDRGVAGILSPEDELLVRQVKERLARIAAALGAHRANRALAAALDGSEMVIRGELAKEDRQQLPSLMPSFILLIALPIVDQDEALALSARASELVAAAVED
jgi:hypothetical protein